jgi:hypothetical protein
LHEFSRIIGVNRRGAETQRRKKEAFSLRLGASAVMGLGQIGREFSLTRRREGYEETENLSAAGN